MENEVYVSAVMRNSNRLYRLALSFVKSHYDAEDIVQDVFIKLLKQNNKFENNEHIDRWLTTVCINQSKDYLKSPFKSRNTSLDDAKDMYSFDNSKGLDIFNAVMSLPKNERVVIHLFYYEDMSTSEIAKALGNKEPAIRVRLHRARNHLKEMLGDDWINE